MTPPERPSAKLPFRVRALLPLGLVLLGILSVRLYGRVPPRPVVELTGATMGTTWSVKLAGDEDEGLGAVSRAISEELEAVDARMSTWRDDSELSRFNASDGAEPAPVSAETQAVLAISQAVAERSGGAFDVTVGPLVQAWGFGSRGRVETPDASTLSALAQRVGFAKLVVDPEAGTWAKRDPGLEVDLSAVAKGYAVDEVAEALQALGRDSFLVEIGGELRAHGRHRDGGAWRVAIEEPDVAGRRIHRVVELRDLAMATSGDYRNFYELDGQRLSHTLDPRTGRPVRHTLASVTVLHPEAVWADAWATALHVLGPEEGYALAAAEGLAAYFLVRSADSSEDAERGSFEIRMTPLFSPHLAAQERRP